MWFFPTFFRVSTLKIEREKVGVTLWVNLTGQTITHQTGNYPVTCFVSKPSRIFLVELSIINTSYEKLPFGSGDYPGKLLFHQWTKFLTHHTGNYPVTCFVSKPSRITLVELSIINLARTSFAREKRSRRTLRYNLTPTLKHVVLFSRRKANTVLSADASFSTIRRVHV